MPPKAKYTREEIINKAYEMTREKGMEAVVARELGKALGTSSSPIFTAFKNMEEVQAEVRKRALQEFADYVSDALNYIPAFKYVGMRMIEFARKEPKLFQLIYFRGQDGGQSFSALVEGLGDTAEACMKIMQKDYKLTEGEAKVLFEQTWLQTFGICALVAENVCTMTMEEISRMLNIGFQGALLFVKGGTKPAGR